MARNGEEGAGIGERGWVVGLRGIMNARCEVLYDDDG